MRASCIATRFVGPQVQTNAVASFCGMLGLTMASDVRTVDALALAAETVRNRRTARAIAAVVPGDRGPGPLPLSALFQATRAMAAF